MQPYGLQTDAMQASALLDIPEGESLGFKNLDDYKRQAGARDFAGNTILSNEAGATAGGAYSTTWRPELRKLAPEFAAGVNQNVFHGFSYATTPECALARLLRVLAAEQRRSGYGESWGPRQPTWTHASDISGYFARNQQVMQSGRNQLDAAVLVQTGYVAAGYGAPFFTARHARGERRCSRTAATTSAGRTRRSASRCWTSRTRSCAASGWRPDGPNFKALVLEGDVAYSRGDPAAGAHGAQAARVGEGRPAGRARRQLERAERPRHRQAGRERARSRALVDRAAGAADACATRRPDRHPGRARRRSASSATSSTPVAPLRRPPTASTGATDYYFIANSHATAASSVEATFAMTDPTAVPYVADAWTRQA